MVRRAETFLLGPGFGGVRAGGRLCGPWAGGAAAAAAYSEVISAQLLGLVATIVPPDTRIGRALLQDLASSPCW
ncbi:MAG: hypothetical protein M3300_13835 [Actinomycetota bacterium]|nr:hypothetical protein [Actinomycetota bacterium]